MPAEESQRQPVLLWKAARAGTLSPWSQAKAWGLKHAWELTHKDGTVHGHNTWTASHLYLEGGSTKKRPTGEAIGQLINQMTDSEWFPGKIMGSGSLGGRPPALSETNQCVIARSAMALKEKGIEPTYPLVIAQCPQCCREP